VYNFAKYAELNHTHKEKVFMEKAWYIVSRSGIEISVPAVPTQEHLICQVIEFPKPCELLVTQEFMEYLKTWVFWKKYLIRKVICENLSKKIYEKYFKILFLNFLFFSFSSWKRMSKAFGTREVHGYNILCGWKFRAVYSPKRFYDILLVSFFHLKLVYLIFIPFCVGKISKAFDKDGLHGNNIILLRLLGLQAQAVQSTKRFLLVSFLDEN